MKTFRLCILASLLVSTSFAHAGLFSWFDRSYTKTKHPIVLVHGLLGFDSILGMEYFYRIPQDLRSDGATVYVVTVAGANSTEARGEQLLSQLEILKALYGHDKFNLFGHSHGSPTSRYVASVAPELVASVTSIGGANKGSPVADLIVSVPEGTFARSVVSAFGKGLAEFLNALSGGDYEQDFLAAMSSLTTEGAITFNAAHPQGVPISRCGEGDYKVNGIRYYSWSGDENVTNLLDPTDYLFLTTGIAFNGEPNDGLVSTCDSHLGKVIRDNYYMNHLDEVNLILGIHDAFTTDPKTVYRQQANRLKKAGL